MKRLYRTKNERMLGGVCGGIGRALDIDPTVIRLVWVLLTLVSLGTGILFYIIAWILIPEEGTGGDGDLGQGLVE
jgi:phage shock protein PspC (stress-responsive transcriptional regulator)